jgi:ATP-dependent DNA ligase
MSTELYPESERIECMKIWKLPTNKRHMLEEVCGNGKYFASLKKDGYWYEYEKTQNYSYMFSRTKSRVTGELSEKSANVPHIMKALDEALPKETIIIGELYYPGQTSKDVTTIMGCLPDKAVQRQGQKGLIHYYMHDIIKLDGEDLMQTPAIDRYNKLKKLYEENNLSQYDFLELAEIIEEDIYNFSINALAQGEEGTVLKLKEGHYFPDKRPAWNTIKIKKFDTIDAFIIGFCDATKEYTGKELMNWQYWEQCNSAGEWSKAISEFYEEYMNDRSHFRPITKPYYFGWKTAFELGAYDENGDIVKIGTISSGLTDELREGFARNPEQYLNKVVEIECMEKNNIDKTLRHGFLVRFRDDKTAEECTIKNIFN